MKQEKKDLIALFVILYIGPIAFYIHAHNSIYTDIDFYIFISAFILMLILPVFIILFKTREVKKDG